MIAFFIGAPLLDLTNYVTGGEQRYPQPVKLLWGRDGPFSDANTAAGLRRAPVLVLSADPQSGT
jgi:hypothetical protein